MFSRSGVLDDRLKTVPGAGGLSQLENTKEYVVSLHKTYVVVGMVFLLNEG